MVADIQTKPFHEQLRHYIGRLYPFTKLGLEELADTVNSPEKPAITGEIIKAICQGTVTGYAPLVLQLADALLLDREEREGFVTSGMEAAESKLNTAPLSVLITEYARQFGLKSERSKAKALGIGIRVLVRAEQDQPILEYKDATALANAFCGNDQQKRHFFKQFSDCLYDDLQVLELLQHKKLGVVKAIRSLAAMRGMDLKSLCEKADIPRSTYTHWSDSGEANTRLPEREYLLTLSEEHALNLNQRRYVEPLCEAADCFYDQVHVARLMNEGTLDLSRTIKALITLQYDSPKAYVAARGVTQNVLADWTSGKIPRTELLVLANRMERPDKITLLEKAGFYLDSRHIQEAFKHSKQLDDFIDAAKTTYGMTNEDFGVNRSTLRNMRQVLHAPRAEGLTQIFLSVQSHAPELDWPEYKRLVSRFLEIDNYSHEYIEFSRRMDACYKQLSAEASAAAGTAPTGHRK
jgi:hypothetical protein